MWERFTERARRVILFAGEEAIRVNSGAVGAEHFLLGLLREDKSVGARVLQEMGLDLERVLTRVIAQMGTVTEISTGEPKFNLEAKRVLELAYDEARSTHRDYSGSEHLLVGMLQGNGVAAKVLHSLGVELENTRTQIAEFLNDHPDLAQRTTAPAPGSIDYAPEWYEILATAKQECDNAGAWQLETIHLLRALCQPESKGAQILRDAGVDVEALLARLEFPAQNASIDETPDETIA